MKIFSPSQVSRNELKSRLVFCVSLFPPAPLGTIKPDIDFFEALIDTIQTWKHFE